MNKKFIRTLLIMAIMIAVSFLGVKTLSPSEQAVEPEIKKTDVLKENITNKEETTTEEVEEQSEVDISSNFTRSKVTKHVDGDTVHVTLDDGQVLKIRMIGIDTPETVHPTKPVEFYGQEASDYTKKSILNKTVYLEKDVSDTDRYGRSLRYIWLEIPNEINEKEIREKMFNAILVAEGYANVSTFPPDVKYQEYFLNFEREARDKNLGLWREEVEATTKTNVENQSSYIGNKNSWKFHDSNCEYGQKTAPHNRIELTRQDAIDQGFQPCKVCNP